MTQIPLLPKKKGAIVLIKWNGYVPCTPLPYPEWVPYLEYYHVPNESAYTNTLVLDKYWWYTYNKYVARCYRYVYYASQLLNRTLFLYSSCHPLSFESTSFFCQGGFLVPSQTLLLAASLCFTYWIEHACHGKLLFRLSVGCTIPILQFAFIYFRVSFVLVSFSLALW